MSNISLQQAAIIVDKAIEHGRAHQFAPLTVVVLDAGGHAVALKREDGSSLLRPQIAHAKAWGALGMGLASRTLFKRAKDNPADRKSTRLNSSHVKRSRMPSSA